MIDDLQCRLRSEQSLTVPCTASKSQIAIRSLSLERFHPLIAEQLAALVLRFWREACPQGGVAEGTTLDILDLCPSAAAARLLTRAIDRRLGDSPRIRYRWIPVQFRHAPADTGHLPSGAGHIADLPSPSLIWDLSNDTAACPVTDSTGRHYRASQPVVVLAHDAWSQLEQQLYAVHYGKLLRANLGKLAAEPDAEGEQELWEEVGADRWDPALDDARRRYLTEFNSAPIVYPSGAFSVIRQMCQLSDRAVLFISRAAGPGDELGVRLGSFAEISGHYRASRKLPVNFPLIAEWAEKHDGYCSSARCGTRHHLQLSLFGRDITRQSMDKLVRCIDPALLSGAEQLVSVMQSLGGDTPLAARLNLLQLSRHDPAVFLAAEKELNAAFARAPDFDRHGWRLALRRVWDNRGACPAGERLHQRLAPAAMRCADWGHARSMLEQGIKECGAQAIDLAQLAWCEFRTGNSGGASELVQRAMQMAPESPLAIQVAERVASRLAQRDSRWMLELADPGLPVVLEPLDASHADALFYQYRDPQIAVMTGLPALGSVEDARAWIAAAGEEQGKVNFAIMHRDWGFTGLVNLAISGYASFFCFWIGVDFQGMGLSSAAGRLVCRHAVGQGVTVMLTSAYKDNHRSIRALKRIGFSELKVRACPPDHDRIFFSLIDCSAGEIDGNAELREYYLREQLPMQFEPLDSQASALASAAQETP